MMSHVLRTLLVVALALGIGSCANDTTLLRVTFHVEAAGIARDATQPMTVHSSRGWDVTLTSAQLAVGPIYFSNTAPQAGTSTEEGRFVAQVLEQFTVDVLNPVPNVIVAGGNGTNEPVLAADLRLFEALDGPIADAAGVDVAVGYVQGFAQQHGTVVSFAGGVVLPSTGQVTDYQFFNEHHVPNIAAGFTATNGGTLTLRIDTTHWFDFVEFDQLHPVGDGTFDLSNPSTQQQLLSGIANGTGVFLFTWTPAP